MATPLNPLSAVLANLGMGQEAPAPPSPADQTLQSAVAPLMSDAPQTPAETPAEASPFDDQIAQLQQAREAIQKRAGSVPDLQTMGVLAQTALRGQQAQSEAQKAAQDFRQTILQQGKTASQVDAADQQNGGDFNYLLGKLFNATPDALLPEKRTKGQLASDMLANMVRSIASDGKFKPVQQERFDRAKEAYTAATSRLQAIASSTRADHLEKALDQTKKQAAIRNAIDAAKSEAMDEQFKAKNKIDSFNAYSGYQLKSLKIQLDAAVEDRKMTQAEADIVYKQGLLQQAKERMQTGQSFEQQATSMARNDLKARGIDMDAPKSPAEVQEIQATINNWAENFAKNYRLAHPQAPRMPRHTILKTPVIAIDPKTGQMTTRVAIQDIAFNPDGTRDVSDVGSTILVSPEDQKKVGEANTMENRFSQTASMIAQGIVSGKAYDTVGLVNGADIVKKLRAGGLLPADMEDNTLQSVLDTNLGLEVQSAAKTLAGGRVSNYDINFIQKYTGNTQMNPENLLLRSMVNQYYNGMSNYMKLMHLPPLTTEEGLNVAKKYITSYVDDVSKHKGSKTYTPPDRITSIAMLKKAYAAEDKILKINPDGTATVIEKPKGGN